MTCRDISLLYLYSKLASFLLTSDIWRRISARILINRRTPANNSALMRLSRRSQWSRRFIHWLPAQYYGTVQCVFRRFTRRWQLQARVKLMWVFVFSLCFFLLFCYILEYILYSKPTIGKIQCDMHYHIKSILTKEKETRVTDADACGQSTKNSFCLNNTVKSRAND